MQKHSRVRSLEAVSKGVYRVTQADGRCLTVFICECYSYGVAEYVETISKIGKLDVVIINSNWCGYTDDLKLQCRRDRIGLFDIRDFMAAINHQNYWIYLNEWDTKKYKEKGAI